MTALHCAALEGSVKVAKILIDAGACLRCFDEEGMTPLHFAAMEGSLDVAEYLFEVGKNFMLYYNGINEHTREVLLLFTVTCNCIRIKSIIGFHRFLYRSTLNRDIRGI